MARAITLDSNVRIFLAFVFLIINSTNIIILLQWYETVTKIYVAGYSISLVFLILATAIFLYFRFENRELKVEKVVLKNVVLFQFIEVHQKHHPHAFVPLLDPA